MEVIKKRYIVDEDQQKVAVQIDIADFEKIEQIFEDYALGKILEENDPNDNLDPEEAKRFYMKHTSCLFIFINFLLYGSGSAQPEPPYYESPSLRIEPLTENTFVHISYLHLPDYGTVSCNGLVYVDDGEALIVDTPTTDSVAAELITWIEEELRCRVKGVVATHFHDDCLSGLAAFHARDIPSYAHRTTLELAAAANMTVPQRGFDSLLVLEVGGETVINRHFGEGHTVDNVVAYVPSESVLFGGCLVKAIGAGKGNLEDANVAAWPATVTNVKRAYPNLKHVVPGHGNAGDAALLDYTVDMFTDK